MVLTFIPHLPLTPLNKQVKVLKTHRTKKCIVDTLGVFQTRYGNVVPVGGRMGKKINTLRQKGLNQVKGDITQILGTLSILNEYDQLGFIHTTVISEC